MCGIVGILGREARGAGSYRRAESVSNIAAMIRRASPRWKNGRLTRLAGPAASCAICKIN